LATAKHRSAAWNKTSAFPISPALKALFIPALHLESEPELTTRFILLAQSARLGDAPAPGIAPYKGLLFFDQADSDLFFGRETLTMHSVDRVTELAIDASSRFLAIIGASGSGKSSLVRAGLAVGLQRTGWKIHIITPTADPLKMLAANYNSSGTKKGQNHMVLVDQFEETFTLCRDENERSAFIERLISIAQDKSAKTTVVIALRADFYSHCAQYPLLRAAVAANQEYIGQMTQEELRRAIEEPAKHGGWEFEPGLVELLLNDLGVDGTGQPEPGLLPLLSHALLATWERRCGRTFTHEGYHASGGVRSAIAETAESVFTDQLNQAQQDIARDIFLRLTELGEGTEDTRRRATLNELVHKSEEAVQLRAVLNTLADARLIILNEDSAEVAHEALIREWQRLHEWLSQDREGLLLHRHLSDSVLEWEARGHDAAELYRGARLAQTREWASVNEERLNPAERAFIAESIEQEQHAALEREAQRQRELKAAKELAETQSRAAKQLRRRALFLSGALFLAIALAVLAVFFGNQANHNATIAQKNAAVAQQNAVSASTSEKQAQSQQLIATSRELAAAAISNIDDDPERSLLLALQAESTADTIEAENALHRSLLATRALLVLHHDAQVWSVTFSPDGKRIATASQDKTGKIWDAKTGQLLLTLMGHTDSVNGIVYSPDGKRIATTSDDHTAKVWDAATGEELLTLSGHTDAVSRIAFSPDGTRLVTASGDKTVKVWDAVTGKELLTLSGHGNIMFDVAFNPDGKRIAASGEDGNVRVWDAISGKELLTLPVEGANDMRGVAFSTDGTRLAVASNGLNMVKVWDAATGEVLMSGNFGHTDFPVDISFSPDGKLAATGGADFKAKVWDTTTGQVLYTLSGHTSGVNGVAFSPDGTRLATASWDHTARVWDITPAKESLFIPRDLQMENQNNARTYDVRYSPDGTRILTDYPAENAVKLWDAITGKELLTFSGHADYLDYSPDGKMVAASSGKAIIVWNAKTGKQLVTLVGHTDLIRCIDFSPDGTHLASASFDSTVIIWDLASGKALFTLQGPKPFFSAAYSPDGKRLVAGDGFGLGIIWDAATGEKLFTLSFNGDTIFSAAFSPDGKRVALANRLGDIGIWDVFTGQELLTLKGHTGRVNSVTFSPDGNLVASASDDGTARVWDSTSGVNLLTLPVDGGSAGDVAFSPDGKRLAVGAIPGVYVFVFPVDKVVAMAKSRLTCTLTLDECQKYLHVQVCPTN
jgi:WD40 repeat protein